jgi:hypothetical protein
MCMDRDGVASSRKILNSTPQPVVQATIEQNQRAGLIWFGFGLMVVLAGVGFVDRRSPYGQVKVF